jgi:NitT/TauT family transport system permease protein
VTAVTFSPRRSTSGRWAGRALPPVAVLGIVIGLWYLTSHSYHDHIRRNQMQPYPHDVVRKGFLISRNFTEMLHSLWRTTQVALVGLVVAMAIGVLLAILMSLSRPVENTLYPYAVVLQTLPIVAITPMMIVWFGSGQLPRVTVCVLISIFPIITNSLFGLKAADRGQRDLFRLHGAGRLTRLWKLDLPGSLPAMFTGFRISAGLSVVGAIVGEFFFKAGALGIGSRIQLYTNRSETAKLIAAITLTAALGITLFLTFGWLANRTTKSWRQDATVRR